MNTIARCTKADLAIITLCTVFLLLSLGAVSQTSHERARGIVCQGNLRQAGLALTAYLNDFDDRYPSPWRWLVKTESPEPNYTRYCRWHDARYPPDGPFWPYLAKDKIVLCPTFNEVARPFAPFHPSHNAAIPIEPQYSYSMNFFLGQKYSSDPTGATYPSYATRPTEVTRSKAEVFLFAEENVWVRPGCFNVLNDTSLCGDDRDWFGTFHNAPADDLNGGTINVVFVDGHVQTVRSALREDPNDNSEKEFGRFEKYAWPYATPPNL